MHWKQIMHIPLQNGNLYNPRWRHGKWQPVAAAPSLFCLTTYLPTYLRLGIVWKCSIHVLIPKHYFVHFEIGNSVSKSPFHSSKLLLNVIDPLCLRRQPPALRCIKVWIICQLLFLIKADKNIAACLFPRCYYFQRLIIHLIPSSQHNFSLTNIGGGNNSGLMGQHLADTQDKETTFFVFLSLFFPFPLCILSLLSLHCDIFCWFNHPPAAITLTRNLCFFPSVFSTYLPLSHSSLLVSP